MERYSMMKSAEAAFIIIDMQWGFIDEASSLCIAGARATIPACATALQTARRLGMPVFHVRRNYAADGSDVEPVRVKTWLAGGRPVCAAGDNPDSVLAPPELAELPGESVIFKPSFSAFYGTTLEADLRARGVRTVVLAGTTSPNCVRSTCYDALARGLNVVVLEDATSSRTPEVQEANIADMAYIGAHIMTTAEFAEHGLQDAPDVAQQATKLLTTLN